jgi:hypothetical protein
MVRHLRFVRSIAWDGTAGDLIPLGTRIEGTRFAAISLLSYSIDSFFDRHGRL